MPGFVTPAHRMDVRAVCIHPEIVVMVPAIKMYLKEAEVSGKDTVQGMTQLLC